MNEFSAAQVTLTETLSQYSTRLDSLETSFTRVTSAHEKVVVVKSGVHKIEQSVASVADKVDDRENRSWRNSVIISGFKEPSDETLASLCENVTKDFLKVKLELIVSGTERCHRIGAHRPNKTRPVILNLVDNREKFRILQNCSKFKGSGLYVTEDFSQNIRLLRKKLWQSTAHNERIKLVFDKVSIDEKFCTWDEGK